MWEGVLVRSTQIKFIAKILRPGGISTLFSPEPPGEHLVRFDAKRRRERTWEAGEEEGEGEERKEGHVEAVQVDQSSRTTVDQRIRLLVPELK